MQRPVLLATIACVALSAPSLAAERGYTVTSFDRIRVEGPYNVTVSSGRGPAVRASGSQAALDAVIARVDGRTLVIQRSTSAWGGFPGQDRGPVTIAVSTPGLVAASLAGSGRLYVDAMRAARIDLAVAGSGRIALGRIEADRLGAVVTGSGGLAIAGHAAIAQLTLNGSGQIDGAKLSVDDGTVTETGSGDISLAVRRVARVQASGSGNVAVTGSPACTVQRLGSGTVTCGVRG
jgi:hypothetical protein